LHAASKPSPLVYLEIKIRSLLCNGGRTSTCGTGANNRLWGEAVPDEILRNRTSRQTQASFATTRLIFSDHFCSNNLAAMVPFRGVKVLSGGRTKEPDRHRPNSKSQEGVDDP
jgi:hypothetical protein